jgi:DNA-directed RNA polymerase
LIHLTFSEPEFTNGNIPFACVHDCVLGRSSDMTFISNLVRQKFVDMYKENILKQWCEQVGVAFDESVMVNTLNIQDVLLSDYFFC